MAATATGALAHTIATTLPVPDVKMAGMAAVPILAAFVGGLLGAAAAIYRRVHVLRALTSLAGACGLAVTAVLLGASVPQGYLVLGVGLAGLAGAGRPSREWASSAWRASGLMCAGSRRAAWVLDWTSLSMHLSLRYT